MQIITPPNSDNEPHEAGLLLLDNSKIKSCFKWKPIWHIDQAVRAVCDWTKAWQRSNIEANEELITQISEYAKQ